jgi:CelD/BcsL family acetyltransferase involved in cellulose biosynthesis
LFHSGTLIGAAALDLMVGPGAAASLDVAAAAAVTELGFLRASWFGAAAEEGLLATLVARRRASGQAIAAVPFAPRRIGPLKVSEVAGSYWPFRSVPLAADADDAELDALLSSSDTRRALGRAWRIGPVYADDPAATRLAAAARRTGWTLAERRIGTCFVVDVRRLTGEGPWPSTKTLRKNRWLERRLAEAGALEFQHVRGGDWSAEVFDRLAGIEAESWVGDPSDANDTKFLDPANRHAWECAVADPALADRLGASILTVGGVPAAFNFTLRAGDTLHIIANSYSKRFADRSPGRILLYRDFQQAAEDGVAKIGWGAGDPGYKSEMGAEPGPAILDLLFVRGAVLGGLARLAWR